MKQKLLGSFLFLFISISGYAQYTSIPDVNFENKLIKLGIDSGQADGKVLTSKINTIQTLDVSASNISNLTGIEDFTQLVILKCSLNKLTYLDVSKFKSLSGLFCNDNELLDLDISKNPILIGIQCGNNNLISLNLKNGFNSKFNLISLKNNPHLNCIQVDDAAYSNSNWNTYKDVNATYSTLCGVKYTMIADSNFEKKLINLGIDKDGLNGRVLTSNIASLVTLDVSNSSISDLTGIEDFFGLTDLNFSNNSITKVNLTWFNKLKKLDCSYNQITDLDFSKNTKLEVLNFSNNKIISTNLLNNPLLITIIANNNLLTALDINGLKILQTIDISNNQLTSLNLSENLALTQLKCSTNMISALNISKNKSLTSIIFGSNKIATFDITSNPLITEISCESNLLTSLNLKNGNNTNFITYDFRNNPALSCIEVDNLDYSISNWSSKKDSSTSFNVYCGPFTSISDLNFENKLISLGIDLDGQNGKIVTAFVSNLTSIDLSNSSITDLTGIQDFVSLTNLNVSGNQLVNLDLSNNKLLKVLNCSNNQIISLDVSKNTLLTDFYCNSNLLKTLNVKNGKNLYLINVDFRNNPNLTCIEVDVVANALKNWSIKKDTTTSFEFICGDYTLIPDYSFETYLISKGIDIDGRNGKVLTSSISGVKKIDVSNYSISNLKGIEDFKSLIELVCNNNKITTLDLSQNLELETLNCSSNLLTDLNLTNSKKLLSLNCSKNSLTRINLTNNLLLQSIDCSINSISELDISQNNALTILKCNLNKLPFFDLSKNVSLVVFDCSFNVVTELDLTLQTLLTDLNCSYNNITSLNISKNIFLTDINCTNNKITSLDFSKNTSLKKINCAANSLLSLNLKNGNNSIYTNVLMGNNVNLLCIQVDSEEDFYLRFKNKDSYANFSENCDQITLIPDSNFEDALIANYIDIDGKNGKVQTFRIKQLTGIPLDSKKISDLTGIQDFKKLQSLDCSNNNLNSIDLSQNLLLETLKCQSNILTSLDVSKNVLLKEIYCQKNKIVDLDISSNKDVTRIDCTENQLQSLNVANGNNKNMFVKYKESDYRKNPFLTCIYVDNVDYSNFNCFGFKDTKAIYSRSCGLYADIPDSNLEAKLIALNIDKDGLNGKILKSDAATVTDLNISGSSIVNVSVLEYFTGLKTLNCSGNDITTLDLNKNTLLISLDCSNTKITRLDLSKNKGLISLNSTNTKLEYVTLKNGNNTKIQSLNLKNNTALTCIEIDDLNYSNINWSAFKDAIATFSVSCGIYTAIPDDNFEYRLIILGIDKDGKNNQVLTSSISNLTLLDLNYSQVTDMTGIQDFKTLKTLYFTNNLVTSVDLSKNTEIEILDCSVNLLASIDLSALKKLKLLQCDNNKLKELNLNQNINLQSIYFNDNELTQINLTNNINLIGISCYRNQLTSLDLTKNGLLKGIYAPQNQLTGLNLSKCLNIVEIVLEDNKITDDALIIPKTAPIQIINLSKNQLTYLDISNYSVLTSLRCDENKLVTLKASNNPLLSELRCVNNELTSLDVTKNKRLQELVCSFNNLTTIDFSGDSVLSIVNCQNNKLTNLDFTPVDSLRELYANNNQLKNLNLSRGFLSSGLSGNITNNPLLTCISVASLSKAQYWVIKKDAIAQYSLDCISITSISDPKFEDFLILSGIDKDGKNGQVLTTNIANITTLDISSLGITDINGIEGFKSLQKLNCSGNSISSINLSSNLMLTYLDCSKNPLTTLNISNNSQLKELYCDGDVTIGNRTVTINRLTSLDISNNTILTKLNCSNNKLISLDLSKNILLTDINCSNNDLNNLNLKNNNNSKLLSINFKNNTSLSCIQVDNESYSIANWSEAKDETAKYSTVCSSLSVDQSIFNRINIYPIPNKGELYINNITLKKVSISNSNGQVVKSISFTLDRINNTIDLKGLPTGVYYLLIETDTAHTTRKIILQ